MAGIQTEDNVLMQRVTTIGSDVKIDSGQPIRLYGLKGEAASTTIVTIKDDAASPATVAVLAAGAISLDRTVDFKGVALPKGMNLNITAGGQNVLVFFAPL